MVQKFISYTLHSKLLFKASFLQTNKQTKQTNKLYFDQSHRNRSYKNPSAINVVQKTKK